MLEGNKWRGSPVNGLHPQELTSPELNDSLIEPSPGTPLPYQDPGVQADPNTRNPAPLHKVKVAQPPAAEPGALPRLLRCLGSRALPPASPKCPGVPAHRRPRSKPAATGVAGRARLSCPGEGGRCWEAGAIHFGQRGEPSREGFLKGGALAS